MRRTTICRFSRLALISIVLGAIAAPSVAQQQAASRPQTVVVQPGHTLWDLAEQYLGDPFLWPAIYRLNTDVVEDPHWIFPGEVLVLVPGAEERTRLELQQPRIVGDDFGRLTDQTHRAVPVVGGGQAFDLG